MNKVAKLLDAMRARHEVTPRAGTRSTIRQRARDLAEAAGLPCPAWAKPVQRRRKPPREPKPAPPPKLPKPAPPPSPKPEPKAPAKYEPYLVREARELRELRARLAADREERWRLAAARDRARWPQRVRLAG